MTGTVTGPLQVAEGYITALRDRDIGRAGSFLAQSGFEYVSPTHRFSSAEALLSYLELTTPIIHDIQTRKVFVDGADVCHVLRVLSQISERKSSEAVQWVTVAGGAIQRIEMFYDAYDYRMLFVSGPQD